MKKTLLFFLLLPFFALAQVDLIKWNAATSSNTKKPIVNASVISSDIASSGGVTVTYNNTWETGNPFFIAGTWPTAQDNEGEYDPTKYVEFQVTPVSGKKLDLSNFNFTYRSQGGSTERFKILYSKDNTFTSGVKTLVSETISSTNWTTINPAFSEEINPVLPGQIVYVRLYVYTSNNNFHFKTSTSGPVITGTVSDFDSNKILAINDYVTAIKNVALNISPLSNDVKKENVTSIVISAAPPATQGTVTINPDKTVTFNPASNFTGTTTFKYTITDASNNSSEAKVQVTIGEEIADSLVMWDGKTTTNRYKETVLSPYVSSNSIVNSTASISYNNSEDSSNPFFSTGSWPSATTASNNSYIEFRIKADNSHQVNLSTFNFVYRNQANNGEQQKFKINYSKDATFSSNVKTLLAETVSNSNTWRTISAPFSSDMNYLSPNETIYIRLYVYNTYNAFQFRTKVNIKGIVKDTNTFAAYSDFATTPSNQSIVIPILSNDVLGTTALQSITVTQPTSGGTVVVNGINNVTFTPTAGFVGTSNFVYTIFNGTLYSSATVSVDVTAPPCSPTGDQVAFGANLWNGYVYKIADNAALPPSITFPALPSSSIATYIGTVTESKNFDRNNGNGAISGATTNFACDAAPSDRFFVRYKMTATITEAGLYGFNLGSDDGIRLYIDGVQVFARWNGHGYVNDYFTSNLSVGDHEFVLEYYEDGGASRTTFYFGLPKGDPTQYGDKVWNVYGYVGNDLTLTNVRYAGNYVDPHLNIYSTAYWTRDKSPSSATIWEGAQVPDDNFTTVFKRKGFVCGQYQIEHINHDDAVQIYIDDVLIYAQDGWNNAYSLVNSGQLYSLNSNSRVEIRLREDGGDANLGFNFVKKDAVYNGTGTIPNGSTLVINGNTTLSSDITVCSCTVNAGYTLTVPTDVTLTVDEDIVVGTGGKLLIQSGGALLQTSTSKTMFSGETTAFEYQRTTNVSRYDLTYWSSPVNNPNFTLHDLSPDTLGDKFYYWDSKWIINYNGTMVMGVGQGYNVRAPQNFDINTPADFTAKFYGTPNNGDISVGLVAGKSSFIGNPYPSAINAYDLISNNDGLGALYFWTHNTPPSKAEGSNVYTYDSADFATYTKLGGAQANSGGVTPTGYIAAGQGFFVKPTISSVLFTNDLRLKANNKTFFKTTGSSEKNRFWLNLKNNESAFKQILIGYTEGATNGWDIDYDAATLNSNTYVDFYSINESKKLTIQGRALPFDNTEVIPLGYKTTIAGEFTIAIDHADGFFDTQAVYLEDKTTGIITDLRSSNYTFTTVTGTFTDRFTLKYTNKTLGTDDFENLENSVLVSVKSKVIKVTSSENIEEVQIYNIGGQLLYNKSKIGSTELQISSLQSSNQVLLVKVILENGHTVTKKAIFN